jgi:muconolactone delta-isomerase
MDFLVAFALDIPAGTPKAEISDRENAEAAATAKLADEGQLVRVWRSGAPAETTIVGLYRADSEAQLDGLLGALPLADWLHVHLRVEHPERHQAIVTLRRSTRSTFLRGGSPLRTMARDSSRLEVLPPCGAVSEVQA